MNILTSKFHSLWNNVFNYSNTDYSNTNINPGSNIKIKNDNNTYIVIGSNINNDLVCCKSTDFYNSIKTTIINKGDIINIVNNTELNYHKKINFD